MLGIKLQRYWHYVYRKCAELQATVQCLLTLQCMHTNICVHTVRSRMI
jgi:hypothetical protein